MAVARHEGERLSARGKEPLRRPQALGEGSQMTMEKGHSYCSSTMRKPRSSRRFDGGRRQTDSRRADLAMSRRDLPDARRHNPSH